MRSQTNCWYMDKLCTCVFVIMHCYLFFMDNIQYYCSRYDLHFSVQSFQRCSEADLATGNRMHKKKKKNSILRLPTERMTWQVRPQALGSASQIMTFHFFCHHIPFSWSWLCAGFAKKLLKVSILHFPFNMKHSKKIQWLVYTCSTHFFTSWISSIGHFPFLWFIQFHTNIFHTNVGLTQNMALESPCLY
jgi:hypothetical protein